MIRSRTTVAIAAAAVFALTVAACSSSSKSSATTTPSATTTVTSAAPAAVPTAKTVSQPVTYGYYDGHIDTMLSTDVSDKAQAASSKINYSAALLNTPVAKNPSLYLISGPAAPGQPMVFGSEPGEDDYSPLWQEITVKWKTGATPVTLTSDNQIHSLAGTGMLTVTATPIVLNCPIIAVTKATTVPTAKTIDQPATYGYYDGHVDTMLSTDVSSKTQAASSHINYSAALTAEAAGKNPALYLISGPAAPGQPMVFGSEPGEDDYSPLWQEITVKWKTGATPVTLGSDDQIHSFESKGELTVTPTPVVLNCPIVAVKVTS